MGHPIFQDAPSRDMTKAQERQSALDAQVEAFLAKGGEIKTYDTLRRPIEQSEFGKFKVTPRPPAPCAAPKAEPIPEPEQPALVDLAEPCTEVLLQEPAPVVAEIQLGRNEVDEVVLATIPVQVPKPTSVDVSKELKAMRRELAAVGRRLDRMQGTAGVKA